jgi:hypothetical protein
MSRGLTDPIEEPGEGGPSLDDLMQVTLSVFFGLEALNKKLDEVLKFIEVNDVEGD